MKAIQAILTCASLCGCAMYDTGPQAELDGIWVIEYISGKPVIDYSPAFMEFDNMDKVSGNASCNAFTGTYVLNGSSVSISKVAITRKMCPDALMEQEQRFVDALGEITRVESVQGLLELKNASGQTVFRASPKN